MLKNINKYAIGKKNEPPPTPILHYVLLPILSFDRPTDK